MIFIVLNVLLLSPCNSQGLRPYYFNMPNFNKGKVYVFTNQNDTTQVQYWHMYTKITNNDTLFVTDGLDQKNRPVEVFVERIKSNNTLMEDYYFIRYDSSGNETKISSTIIKNQVYSFNYLKDSLVWSVKYEDTYGEEQLSKTRSLKKLDVKQIIGGESYQCVLFRDDFNVHLTNTNQTYNFYQDSYYAKNIGLVRFVRTLSNGVVMDYQLTEVIEK